MTPIIVACILTQLRGRRRVKTTHPPATTTDPHHDTYCPCPECEYARAAEADMWDTYFDARRLH